MNKLEKMITIYQTVINSDASYEFKLLKKGEFEAELNHMIEENTKFLVGVKRTMSLCLLEGDVEESINLLIDTVDRRNLKIRSILNKVLYQDVN